MNSVPFDEAIKRLVEGDHIYAIYHHEKNIEPGVNYGGGNQRWVRSHLLEEMK